MKVLLFILGLVVVYLLFGKQIIAFILNMAHYHAVNNAALDAQSIAQTGVPVPAHKKKGRFWTFMAQNVGLPLLHTVVSLPGEVIGAAVKSA